MREALILIEGQTEERFIKDVLSPYLQGQGVWLTPTIIKTKRTSDGTTFKGGITDFGQLRRDLSLLLNGAGSRLVTTMMDLYGLPTDVPGMTTSGPLHGAIKARHVESSIRMHFGSPANLLPFVMVHEFEALLFVDTAVIAATTARRNVESILRAESGGFATPEEINERPESSPSKRLLRIIPGYSKLLHGTAAAKRIGIDSMRSRCPHFRSWISGIAAFHG